MNCIRTAFWRSTALAALVVLSLSGCENKLAAYPDELAGVGVVLQSTPAGHSISRVFSGGPADTAGLQVGDRILTVNGESTEGKSLATVVDTLRGQDGSPVVVRVASAKGGDVTVTLTRQHLAKNGGNYAPR